MSQCKKVIILGATGNIGLTALNIIKQNPHLFKVKTLIADGNNVKILAQLAKEHKIDKIVVKNCSKFHELQFELKAIESYCEVFCGQSAIFDATTEEHDICISAISGISGIIPTFSVIPHIKTLILANKDSLLCLGNILLDEAKRYNVTVIPVDLENNGIFQILSDKNGKIESDAVKKISLSVSSSSPGKYIAHRIRKYKKNLSTQNELKAGILSKSLDMIETSYLFQVDINNIEILLQRKHIIHGIISLKNGSQILHASRPEIDVSLRYAMSWPLNNINSEEMSMHNISDITFDSINTAKYPIIQMARDSWKSGSNAVIKLNTAVDLAIASFLSGRIEFDSVQNVVSDVMSEYDSGPKKIQTLLDIMAQYDATIAIVKNVLEKYYL